MKHKNNVSVIIGEVIKRGDRYHFITFRFTLSQYRVETHFEAKIHLDKVNGITEDITEDITDDNTISIANTISEDNNISKDNNITKE